MRRNQNVKKREGDMDTMQVGHQKMLKKGELVHYPPSGPGPNIFWEVVFLKKRRFRSTNLGIDEGRYVKGNTYFDSVFCCFSYKVFGTCSDKTEN